MMVKPLCSVFANEIEGYLCVLSECASEKHYNEVRYTLYDLDAYLASREASEKHLQEDTLIRWLTGKSIKPQSKKNLLAHVNGFSKYLVSLGYQVVIPEPPFPARDYVPYIFSDEEFSRLIKAADSIGILIPAASLDAGYQIPLLIRVLYCTGMRSGEAISLAWNNIDMENGIIHALKAKNSKSRAIPISPSLCELLKSYKMMAQSKGRCREYVFESSNSPGVPHGKTFFRSWFGLVLQAAGINYTRKTPYERGPCLHCLRHLFTVQSFLKSESEGRPFEESVPFISTYLGHAGITETEKYLKADYTFYTRSHQRVERHIDHLFPEVTFV